MQFSTRKRFRLVTGALLLLLLIATPLAFGLGLPAHRGHELPGALGAYSRGLTELGMAGMVALPLAGVFALWIMLGEHRNTKRRFLAQRVRTRHYLASVARTLAVILGGAALIVGSLAAIYAGLVAMRPDQFLGPRLPLTFNLAIPCLLLGAVAYTAGRFAR